MLPCYYSFFSFNKMVHESRPFGLLTMSLSVMHESAHDTEIFSIFGQECRYDKKNYLGSENG